MDLGRDSSTLIREYLTLGLRFDRVEEGYVDAFTGDPALKRAVDAEPQPDPADLARQAERLLAELPAGLDDARAARRWCRTHRMPPTHRTFCSNSAWCFAITTAVTHCTNAACAAPV